MKWFRTADGIFHVDNIERVQIVPSKTYATEAAALDAFELLVASTKTL